jgi:citrate synthase
MKNESETHYCTVTSDEVCQSLGISRDTLYAYVSRGLVRTIAHPGDARKSLYDRRDVEFLAARKRRGRSRRAVAASTINWGEPVLSSKITRIADGQYFYRGKNAVELSDTQTLEEVLFLLSRVRCRPAGQVRAAVAAMPDRLPFNRILTMMAGEAVFHLKSDGRPRAGQIMRLTALRAAGSEDNSDLPIHQVLARAWSADTGASELIRRALVLCADHELNASTYAARVAASAGASLPASLLAGLATLSGSGHGGLTNKCRAWMKSVESENTSTPACLLPPDGKPPPGFGHPLYPDGDPRATVLLRHCPVSDRWRQWIRQVQDATGSRPALDFALAHLERQLELPDGSGLGIFAVGRTAGWIAHVFEQRQSGQLIRPRASFDG